MNENHCYYGSHYGFHYRARGLHLRKPARPLRQNLPIMVSIMVSITVSITVLGGRPEKNRAGNTVFPSSDQSKCGLTAPMGIPKPSFSMVACAGVNATSGMSVI